MHIKLVQYEIFSMKLFSSTTEHPNIKYWVYMMHNQTKIQWSSKNSDFSLKCRSASILVENFKKLIPP